VGNPEPTFVVSTSLPYLRVGEECAKRVSDENQRREIAKRDSEESERRESAKRESEEWEQREPAKRGERREEKTVSRER
jgi:hypothetical protein